MKLPRFLTRGALRIAVEAPRKLARGGSVRFVLTDLASNVTVETSRAVPQLFAEGKGVIAEGVYGADRVFHADERSAVAPRRFAEITAVLSLARRALPKRLSTYPARATAVSTYPAIA